MSTGHNQPQPSEEELRAAYEEQIKQIRVEHILLDEVVTLVNLGMRRTGLAAGTEEERDADQVRLAIEAVRALLPVLEQTAPQQAGQIRDALSQLQLAYVRIGGRAEPSGEPPEAGESPAGAPAQEPPPPEAGQPGPAQRSGKLWVPGQ